MTNLRIKLLIFGCLFLPIMSGCDSGSNLTEADIQATVDAAVAATTVALAPPTFTPIPTITPEGQEIAEEVNEGVVEAATDTPVPEPTATPEPTLTPTPSAPFVAEPLDGGLTRYNLPFEQFALTLSDEWLVADIFETTDSADQRQLEELLGSGIFRNLVAAGIKFYAINWNEASRDSLSPVNINLTIQNAAETAQQSIDWLSPDLAAQLAYEAGIEAELVEQAPASLGDQATTRLAYSLPQVNPLERDFALDFVIHVTQVGERVYILALTAPSDISAEFLPAAEAELQSAEFYGN